MRTKPIDWQSLFLWLEIMAIGLGFTSACEQRTQASGPYTTCSVKIVFYDRHNLPVGDTVKHNVFDIWIDHDNGDIVWTTHPGQDPPYRMPKPRFARACTMDNLKETCREHNRGR